MKLSLVISFSVGGRNQSIDAGTVWRESVGRLVVCRISLILQIEMQLSSSKYMVTVRADRICRTLT